MYGVCVVLRWIFVSEIILTAATIIFLMKFSISVTSSVCFHVDLITMDYNSKDTSIYMFKHTKNGKNI